MTKSRDARKENADLALTFMLEELRDAGIDKLFIKPQDAQYASILQTSWKELEDSRLVKSVGPYFQLTGAGWLKALDVKGRLDDSALRVPVGRIMATLKAYIPGRHEKAYAVASTVAQQAGVSEDFLFNVIESRFIEVVLDRHGASWENPRMKNVLVIPVDFGQDLAPL